MFDSLQQIARFGEIAAGTPVQFGRTGRIAIRQPAKHRFTKQAMIAIMTVLPVWYIKKQARRIGGIKRRPRILASRDPSRSEEPTSKIQSLSRNSYAVSCLT